MYSWHAKEYVNDIGLLNHLQDLEEDMLPDRKGAQCVGYLSDGMDYGVHAAAADLGPTQRIP